MADRGGSAGDPKQSPMLFVRTALDWLFSTSLKRVLTLLIVTGAALLGLTWTDVLVAIILQQSGTDPAPFVTFAQLVGLGMIITGVAGHIVLHRGETRASRNAGYDAEFRAAMVLVGRLQVLVRGFRDETVERDPGFYNKELMDCSRAAQGFQDVASPSFQGDAVIASIASPKVDASKKKPYFDLDLTEIEQLIQRIEAHYEAAGAGPRTR